MRCATSQASLEHTKPSKKGLLGSISLRWWVGAEATRPIFFHCVWPCYTSPSHLAPATLPFSFLRSLSFLLSRSLQPTRHPAHLHRRRLDLEHHVVTLCLHICFLRRRLHRQIVRKYLRFCPHPNFKNGTLHVYWKQRLGHCFLPHRDP